MFAWLTTHLYSWILAAVPIGTMSFAAGQFIKRASAWVDAQPTAFKRFALLPVIATAVTALGAALHVNIVCDQATNCLANLDAGTLDAAIKAALGVVVAWITHASRNGSTAT